MRRHFHLSDEGPVFVETINHHAAFPSCEHLRLQFKTDFRFSMFDLRCRDTGFSKCRPDVVINYATMHYRTCET